MTTYQARKKGLTEFNFIDNKKYLEISSKIICNNDWNRNQIFDTEIAEFNCVENKLKHIFMIEILLIWSMP